MYVDALTTGDLPIDPKATEVTVTKIQKTHRILEYNCMSDWTHEPL